METETPSAATLVQLEETILLQHFIFCSPDHLSDKYVFCSLQCSIPYRIPSHRSACRDQSLCWLPAAEFLPESCLPPPYRLQLAWQVVKAWCSWAHHMCLEQFVLSEDFLLWCSAGSNVLVINLPFTILQHCAWYYLLLVNSVGHWSWTHSNFF